MATLLGLMDEIAGESVTDAILGGFVRSRLGVTFKDMERMSERDLMALTIRVAQEMGGGEGQRAFEAMPLSEQIAAARAALDTDTLDVCAEQLGVTADELRGRVESVYLAARIGGEGGTVVVG